MDYMIHTKELEELITDLIKEYTAKKNIEVIMETDYFDGAIDIKVRG